MQGLTMDYELNVPAILRRAEELFAESLDAIVDGGATRGGLPSTLLDATADPPRVLRAGAFPWPPP